MKDKREQKYGTKLEKKIYVRQSMTNKDKNYNREG